MSLREGFQRVALHLHAQAITASGNDQDDFYRSAISRAYYAAFHHTREYVQLHHGYRLSRGPQAHAEVIEEIRRINPRLGDHLFDLRVLRNAVDYDDMLRTSLPSAWHRTSHILEGIIRALPLP